MKPNLDDILNAALKTLNIEYVEWENLRHSRMRYIIRAKELFCLLAAEEGYSYSAIGKYLKANHTSARHHVNKFKAHCEIYPDCHSLVKRARSLIPRPCPAEHVTHAYLARCKSGNLVISTSKLIDAAGYWIAEGARPYYPNTAFPQITYESSPARVSVIVKINEDEKV